MGTAALSLQRIQEDLKYIKQNLPEDRQFGANLICHLSNPKTEMDRVELFLRMGVDCIEAAAFMVITPALVYFRLKGLHRKSNGSVACENHIIAKVSRPEIARAFLSPAPQGILESLLIEGKITETQAQMAREVPMSHDICVEADSGGHTDQRVASVFFPAISQIRDDMQKQYLKHERIHVGLAGGIGTPHAVIGAYMMGADFILTGSINQCTVESGASPEVKDLLEKINVQDTDYAPAGDMFEIGAKVQVLKRGVFFPARANKLFMLYKHYEAWRDIPDITKSQIEKKFFKRTFNEVWEEVKNYHASKGQEKTVQEAMNNEKHKMALVFRWYFSYTTRLAFAGDLEYKTDFQVHTGPALGAFNQWVKGGELESWRSRHVDQIAEKLMTASAKKLTRKLNSFIS